MPAVGNADCFQILIGMVRQRTSRFLLGCMLVGTTTISLAKPADTEPRYEGVFSYWDARSQSYVSLPRETPETKTKVRALGFGGAKALMRWPTATCTKRFNASAVPKFVVRITSAQKDPHDFIQFFKVEANGQDRRLTVATAGTFGMSSRTTLQDGAIGFDANEIGSSSVAIVPQVPLTPGEYVFSSVDSQNSYCFGVDASAGSGTLSNAAQSAPGKNSAGRPSAAIGTSASASPQYRNDPRVRFRATCPGLYIIKVYETQYEGMIPAYALDFVNVSDARYEVSYDLTYTKRGSGPYLGHSVKSYTEERHFTSRPNRGGEVYTIMLAKKNDGAYFIASMDAVEVFKCDKT